MKWNKPLIIGSIILLLLLVVTLVPDLLTSKNPYSIMTLKYQAERVDGEIVFEQAPFEPSERNIWGTDELGRDIYSFVIYGTRLTLKIAFFVTIFRFLIGLPLGILSGFNHSLPKNIIRQVNILFSGLPPLLFAIFVLHLNVFSKLEKTWSTFAFIVVLTIVGFGKLASAFEEATRNILTRPYITSEYLLGKSRYEVAIENVLPHIMPEVVILFFMEVARVLTLQIQLGLFSIFIGNLKILLGDDFGVIRYWNVSFEPEWASLLGYASQSLNVAPWMVIYPTIAFFISVLGFNMFGEGLRIQLQDRQSSFIPKVRKIIAFVLIKKHRHQNIKPLKPLLIGLAVILLMVLLTSDFESYDLGEKEYIGMDELPERLYVGMNEIDDISLRLSKAMEEMGLEPVYDDYEVVYEISQNYYVLHSDLKVDGVSYVQGVDYVVRNFIDNENRHLDIVDARDESLYNEAYYSRYQDKAAWIDGQYYTKEAIELFSERLYEAGCQALIVSNHLWKTSKGSFTGKLPIIGVHGDVEIGSTMTFSSQSELLSDRGINVIGMVKGHDINASQEVIVLGFPLNYKDAEDGYKTYNYALELMENMQSDNSRTLVLAFFDGTYETENHGIMPYSTGMIFDPYMHTEYFNFRDIDYGQENTLINRDMSPMTKYFAVSFFQSLERSGLNYELVSEKEPDNLMDLIKHPDYVMHHKKGIDTLVFDIYSDAELFYESLYYALKENN